MKLAGFNFTKIHAEKSKKSVKEVKIDTKINIDSIKEIKSDFTNSNESILGVDFDYSIEYKDLATISFSGNVVLMVDSKEAKQTVKDFEKKKVDDNFKIAVFNLILKKSSVKALQLEEELNLPSHFRLPTLKPQEKK